jgi:hypothetical protein
MKHEGAAQQTTAKDQKAKEPTFAYNDLLQNAKRFGEKPEVLAGALHGSNKGEYTIAEVEAAIKKFKAKEVK